MGHDRVIMVKREAIFQHFSRNIQFDCQLKKSLRMMPNEAAQARLTSKSVTGERLPDNRASIHK